MSKINDEFMEAYKRIDHFCKDALGTDKGVTSYIDEMREKTDGYKYVPGWKEDLDNLVRYRHIRNNYSHEIGSSYSDICEWNDVFWLREFHEKLLKVKDPLSLYKAAKTPVKSKQSSYSRNDTDYYPDNYQDDSDYEESNRKSGISLGLGVFLIFIMLISLAAVALGIACIIVL